MLSALLTHIQEGKISCFFPRKIYCHDHRQANIIYKIHMYIHTHTQIRNQEIPLEVNLNQ